MAAANNEGEDAVEQETDLAFSAAFADIPPGGRSREEARARKAARDAISAVFRARFEAGRPIAGQLDPPSSSSASSGGDAGLPGGAAAVAPEPGAPPPGGAEEPSPDVPREERSRTACLSPIAGVCAQFILLGAVFCALRSWHARPQPREHRLVKLRTEPEVGCAQT
jgi:hypothetical protein